MAFEGSSSKAMYIFNQSATLYQMSWRTWTAAGGFSSVTTESGSTAEINFMQAHGYTNGNDIMAVYSDKNEDLYHRKWDGSSWTALDTALETEISRVNGKEPFMFAWQALTTSNSGTTSMAVWSAAGIPEYNVWDGSSFTTTLGAVTQTDRWRIMAGAAAPTRDEKIVVGIENSSNEISGELWNGSSWSKTSLTALANVSQSYWWGADVAYEQQSGDAVLVWTGGTTYANQLRYQVWNGSSWTAPANIAAYTGSTPMQMQLAANPNSDEMVLVVNDSNENDYALVWDGSSWGNLQPLASSTTDDRTDIFVAYEQQSGRAIVVYGNGTSSVYYRIWNGSIWSGANSVAPPSGVDGYARWTTLGSDPNSNRIVMGVTTSGSDPWLSVWNGSSWDASVLASALNSTPTTTAPNIAVAFESSSGQAMAVSGASDNKMIYKTWTSGTGWSGATAPIHLWLPAAVTP